MKLSTYLQVPEWFTIRHPVQEDVMDSAVRDFERTEEIKRKGMDQAKAEALPYFAEIVRDMDARSAATIRGGIRAWTPDTYKRVMANRSVFQKCRKWFSTSFFQSFV